MAVNPPAGRSRLVRPPSALRIATLAIGFLLALFAFIGFQVRLAAAADPAVFGEGSATSKFGQFIDFKQPVTLATEPKRVEALISTPGSIGPTVIPIVETTPAGASTLEYRVDLTDGHVVPNTMFTTRFRVVDAAGVVSLGPPIRHTYVDDRFTWKSLTGTVVRVHWVDGNQAFGQRALRIGDDAVTAAASILGVTESDPIDFFIYAEQGAFYDALGPATRENVGGQAHPDIRTLFALITPADLDASWVESVVPHELTHVVFATAVDNAYHAPPHWLNEGLAVYLSDGYDDSYRSQVELASQANEIIPLDGLAGAFPTTQERFFLAYAESVSAVDSIVKTSGRDVLVKLIRSYQDGVSDDDAFRAALGKDVAGFQAAWLESLGAKAPPRSGPRPAPAGPLPAGWEGPQPNPSFEVVGSIEPNAPAAPVPQPGRSEPGVFGLISGIVAIGAVLVAVLLVLAVRSVRGRPAIASSGGEAGGGNRLFGRPLADDEPVPAPPATTSPWTTADWSLPKDANSGSDPAEPAPPTEDRGPRSDAGT